ncbi:S-acyl fatty acid synthase thioesterase, medium chain [Gracilinanus agilis]|uniref:S-acyl fatty acid synthase thioesterase, medium chain n=1 Tax=Gracilinanus agilis TaxID=191870 RepID=UPI001CFD5751|nr:S-acyl fatty acid synthase thioesterase, medium chain [Gracilinanus agilis]
MESNKLVEEMRTENVVNCLYQQPDTIFKLICFPWAGSGSIHFAKWGKSFHHSIEVSSIRLPGRESRYKEPFATNLEHVIAEISNALLPLLQDIPFAFFGHSMGSYIAYLTAQHLKQNHGLEPVHIFVSSTSAPHKKPHFYLASTTSMSEEQLHHFIINMGGTPKEILENKELLEMFLPVFKADVRMTSNYTFVKPSKALLSCDITCFSGTEDLVEMEGWEDLTSGSVDNYRLPGDHFYLIKPSNETFIINYITKCLELSHFA